MSIYRQGKWIEECALGYIFRTEQPGTVKLWTLGSKSALSKEFSRGSLWTNLLREDQVERAFSDEVLLCKGMVCIGWVYPKTGHDSTTIIPVFRYCGRPKSDKACPNYFYTTDIGEIQRCDAGALGFEFESVLCFLPSPHPGRVRVRPVLDPTSIDQPAISDYIKGDSCWSQEVACLNPVSALQFRRRLQCIDRAYPVSFACNVHQFEKLPMEWVITCPFSIRNQLPFRLKCEFKQVGVSSPFIRSIAAKQQAGFSFFSPDHDVILRMCVTDDAATCLEHWSDQCNLGRLMNAGIDFDAMLSWLSVPIKLPGSSVVHLQINATPFTESHGQTILTVSSNYTIQNFTALPDFQLFSCQDTTASCKVRLWAPDTTSLNNIGSIALFATKSNLAQKDILMCHGNIDAGGVYTSTPFSFAEAALSGVLLNAVGISNDLSGSPPYILLIAVTPESAGTLVTFYPSFVFVNKTEDMILCNVMTENKVWKDSDVFELPPHAEINKTLKKNVFLCRIRRVSTEWSQAFSFDAEAPAALKLDPTATSSISRTSSTKNLLESSLLEVKVKNNSFCKHVSISSVGPVPPLRFENHSSIPVNGIQFLIIYI